MNKISVLFVCLGNICRSPMAEAVFRTQVEKADLSHLIEIESAGTGDWHLGHPPHAQTQAVLERHHIVCESKRARLFVAEDGAKFDYIIAMDSRNEADIRQLLEGVYTKAEIFRFLSLLPEKGLQDVPDPYYTGNFDEVFDMIGLGCERLLDQLRKRLGAD